MLGFPLWLCAFLALAEEISTKYLVIEAPHIDDQFDPPVIVNPVANARRMLNLDTFYGQQLESNKPDPSDEMEWLLDQYPPSRKPEAHQRRRGRPREDWEQDFPEIELIKDSHLKSLTTIREGQTLVVQLPVQPTPDRQFVWKMNVTYDSSTYMINRQQLRSQGLAATGALQFNIAASGYLTSKVGARKAHQQFVFRGLEPGLVQMAFLYSRPWFCDLQPGGAVSYVAVRILPRYVLKRLDAYVPVIRSTIQVSKGQLLNIKLGHSLQLPYNVWKLMDVFDPHNGHLTNVKEAPQILEYRLDESGYVAPGGPESTGDPAGYQMFTFFAKGPGEQNVTFSFVKPWLPDEQFERSDTVITVVVQEDGESRS
eukprot:Blabericola_migrator_1__12669@NODE_80_length_15038_cov_227_068532_g72_i0_p4_GENE_NODE_80_length_15038_cov_227_068532_g72_i0NODE_80_length_15038_cov_227_068532_g72_i0_p4_ORF_typecomplete_len369_score43_51Inhibitor_I42/PF09394_10/0_00071Inhibitor_I42/PF09394_10/0_00091_NODE_80_length_15038_cov_227_068532_g72_i01256013666